MQKQDSSAVSGSQITLWQAALPLIVLVFLLLGFVSC